MKSKDIQIGGTYMAKVSGKVVAVKVIAHQERFTTASPNGRDYWVCESLVTGRRVEVKSCQRFRVPVIKAGVTPP